MTKTLTCISCPIGCTLEVQWSSEEDISVSGNRCTRGEIYGREEILAPKRVVTATVSLDSETVPRLPVKTDAALGKEHITPLLQALYELRVSPPVECGQTILEDVAGTGINVVATRSVTE